jgi:uncharacterized membrane protein
MKRKILLVLGCLFLLLWLTGLIYTRQTSAIHIALIVSLLFFMRSLMVIEKAPATKVASETTMVNIPAKETVSV